MSDLSFQEYCKRYLKIKPEVVMPSLYFHSSNHYAMFGGDFVSNIKVEREPVKTPITSVVAHKGAGCLRLEPCVVGYGNQRVRVSTKFAVELTPGDAIRMGRALVELGEQQGGVAS